MSDEELRHRLTEIDDRVANGNGSHGCMSVLLILIFIMEACR